MNHGANPLLRKLRGRDIPSAAQLSSEAGWNQTEADWRMLIDLASQGCLAIEVDGVLAATATLLRYEKRLAWIGMVLTRRSYQGRGFARRLLTEALTLADQAGIETLKLDATAQGRPLYEKLGFRHEQVVERWEGPTGDLDAKQESISPTPAAGDWVRADGCAFGADRSKLLASLAQGNPPLVLGSSYLLTRPGRMRQYLGPCVAESPAVARALIQHALHSPSSGGWYWDLAVENSNAISLARDLGFTPKRQLTRMVRGKNLRGEESYLYALAGFEFG